MVRPDSASPSSSADTPARRLAVVQSSYIPWKGYFDLIGRADVFVLLDDVEFSKNSWRNRNRIKTAAGPRWLTIPVRISGHSHDAIKDIEIADPLWGRRHWDALAASYRHAPHFREMRPSLEPLFLDGAGEPRLSQINFRFITAICALLGIATTIRWSMEFSLPEGRNERLIALCRQAGATEYISGPAARAYLDVEQFARAGIAVSFMSYEGYPEYPQLYPPFDHEVSILDLLFNVGHEAHRFLLSGAVPHRSPSSGLSP
jgi:hypothetical protein